MMEQLELIISKLDELTHDVRAVRYAIHGNGVPGLKTRVDRLERGMTLKTKVVAGVLALLAAVGAPYVTARLAVRAELPATAASSPPPPSSQVSREPPAPARPLHP